jgi:uncharacterized membrane protein YccC
MSRGKYATRAEAQRDRKVLVDDVDAQRRRIAQLVAENVRLRERAETERGAAAARIRTLIAQNQEGTSDALEAAHRLIDSLREQMGQIRGQAEQRERHRETLIHNVLTHLREADGMTLAESVEELSRLHGGTDIGPFVWEPKTQEKIGPDGVRAVQRARGERR